MSTTPGLRPGLVLVVTAMVVAVAGCSTPAVTPTSPVPSRTSLSGARSANSAPGSAQARDANADDDAPPPDQDGHPACAAYDSWRPGPDAARGSPSPTGMRGSTR